MKITTRLNKNYVALTGHACVSVGGVWHTEQKQTHEVDENQLRTIEAKMHNGVQIVEIIKPKEKKEVS